MKGWDVKWQAETLPSCCTKGGLAFQAGEVIVEEVEKNGCLRRREECTEEEGRTMVVRTLTTTCCGLKIADRHRARDQQKWRIQDQKLLNKYYPGNPNVLRDGTMILADETDDAVLTIAFENGSFLNPSPGLQLAAAVDGFVSLGQMVDKREVLARVCAELGGHTFHSFTYIEADSECWQDVESKFGLYKAPDVSSVIAD